VGSDLPDTDVQAMLYEVDPTAAASAAAAGRTFCVYYDMFVQFWRDQLNQRYGKSGSSIFDKVTRRSVTRHSILCVSESSWCAFCCDCSLVAMKAFMYA
jgi:hypothetical protein